MTCAGTLVSLRRMGLPADQLGADEHVVLTMREHWKHLLGAAVVSLAALAGLAVVLAIGPDSGFFAWLSTLGWVAFGGVVLVFGVWPFLRWHQRTYTLTNRRLATREGIVRRSGRDIPISRINDVAFEQAVLDRLTHAGTLKVSSASEDGTVVLHDIPDIHAVARSLNELVRTAR